MVFFIDDLDRMRKEKLHELMELLNMLSSDNREAFFVLGMDYQRVVKHLEQELKNVHGTEEQKASLYLHKMVNVVFTPVAASDYESMIDKPSAVKHLENGFDNRERHKYYRVQRVVKPLDGLLGIAVLGLLALGAWKLLHTLADVDTTLMATAKQGATLQARAIEKEKPLSENRTETSGQKASQEVQRREQLKPTPREHAQSYAPRRTNPPSTNGTQDALWRWWPSVLILVVLALAPLMVIAEDWAQPGDSANLKRILRAFSRTLAGLRGTPRQFKRSTNLLRMIDLYKESTNDRLSYYMLGQLTVVYVLKMLGLDSESKQLAFWQEFESCAASNREQIVRTLTEWLKKEAEYPDPEFYQKNIESMVDRFVDDYEEWRTGDHRFDPDNIASLNRLLMAFS